MNQKSTLPALTAPASGLVLPEQLAQQAADPVRELLSEAAAANTTRSYAAALRYWAGWHQARFGIELTLPVNEGRGHPIPGRSHSAQEQDRPGQRAATDRRPSAGGRGP